MAGITRYAHHVLVTKNSRYDVVDNVCVAVRDQRTGMWSQSHPAIGARVVGAMSKSGVGATTLHPGLPVAGECLVFSNDIVTSPLVSVSCIDPESPDISWQNEAA